MEKERKRKGKRKIRQERKRKEKGKGKRKGNNKRKEERTHPADWVKKRQRPYFCQNQPKHCMYGRCNLKEEGNGKVKEYKTWNRKGKKKRKKDRGKKRIGIRRVPRRVRAGFP